MRVVNGLSELPEVRYRLFSGELRSRGFPSSIGYFTIENFRVSAAVWLEDAGFGLDTVGFDAAVNSVMLGHIHRSLRVDPNYV